MALSHFQIVVTDEAGNIIVNPIGYVTKEGTGEPAVLFSDYNGTTRIDNPYQTSGSKGAGGVLDFYVGPGRYKVEPYKDAYSAIPLRDVLLGTAAGTDAGAFNLMGTWDPGISYGASDLVSLGGALFASRVDGNLAHSPSISPPATDAYWMLIPTLTAGDFIDVAMFAQGDYIGGELLFRMELADTAVFPASLTGSKFSAVTAATGTVTMSVKKNGVQFATINFAAGVTEATFTAASDASFVIGDILTITAPASRDATLANVAGTLRGTRNASVAAAQSGVAVVDFGAFPGSPMATVAVTGQANITTGSDVMAELTATGSTTDHSADEHKVAAMRVRVSDLVAGTGFTINAMCAETGEQNRHWGQFNIAWRWA